MKRLVILLLCLLAAATPLQAQSIKVITEATLIDVKGGAPLEDAVIVIEGTRISQVGPSTRIKIPPGAHLIKARGKFVIPGLADMHNHLGDGTFVFTREPDFKKNLANMLGWGFTTIFAPGFSPGINKTTFAELKNISAENTAPYPHFFGSGRKVAARESGLQNGYTPETVEQAREIVREQKADNVDAVKLVYTDLTYAKKQPQPMLKPDVMAAIIDEAHKQNLKVYVHAPILKYAKEVLRAGADGLVHGVISDPVDSEFISLMKKNHAFYITTHSIFEAAADIAGWARRQAMFDERRITPREVFDIGASPAKVHEQATNFDNLPYIRQRLTIMRSNLRKVANAGIPIVVGSDTGSGGSGVVRGVASQLELQLLVESGLKPIEVLKAATINAAKMIGRERDLGTIAPGKLADLVILDADPLADITNVRRIYRVIKGGVSYNPTAILQEAK